MRSATRGAFAALLLLASSPAWADSHGGTAEGKQLYQQLCAACHGRYGRGDGPVASQLPAPPPDFTRPELLAGRTDTQVVDGIAARTGAGQHTPMVVAQAFERDKLEAAIAYMRTLATPGRHVSVPAGRDIYETFCWICHGVEGNGRGPAAAELDGPKPRDFTSADFVVKGREAELERTITEGAASSIHGSKYMLEWGTKLSPQQVRDVIAYIGTLHAAAQK